MSTFEKLSLLLTGLGIVAILLQLRAVRTEIYQTGRIAEEDHRRRRREATLSFMATSLEKRSEWRDKLPDDRDREGIAAFIADCMPTQGGKNAEKTKDISGYLAHHEDIATGVQLGVFDIDTVDLLMGPRLVSTFRNWEVWIKDYRIACDEHVLYIEWECVVEAIESRREKDPFAELIRNGTGFPLPAGRLEAHGLWSEDGRAEANAEDPARGG